MVNLLLTVGGLLLASIGIGINWGVGHALLVAGLVCFAAGALNDARGRRP